jgi:decaprenyl-phosphate phosphoribosyltransferase
VEPAHPQGANAPSTAVELTPPVAVRRAFPLRALLLALRPHQWVKNLFVLAPLIFAKRLGDPVLCVTAVGATLVFCLLSGVVYLVNDLVDVEADRRHPVKRLRPIAAGQLAEDTAKRAAAALGAVALVAALLLDWRFCLASFGYLCLNLAYSLWAKQIAYVDVLCVATGFLLRVIAGALAIQVEVSVWIVLCAFLLALFLALGKRRHELKLTNGAGDTRAALLRYTPAAVDVASYAVGILTLAAYLVYTLSPRTRAHFETDLLPATTPFIAFGLWRFLGVIDHAQSESPTEAMLRDAPLVVNALMWVGFVLVAIYVNP